MGELQARPVYLDQAQLLGAHEGPRIWTGQPWLPRPGPGRRPPRPAAARLAPARAGRRTGRRGRRLAGRSGAAARRPTAGWPRDRRRSPSPARSAPWDYRQLGRAPAAWPARGAGTVARPADGRRLPRTAARRCSSGKPRSKPEGGACPRAPTSSTTRSASRRLPAKARASSELRSSHGRRRRPPGPGSVRTDPTSKVRTAHRVEQRVGSNGVRRKAQRPQQGVGLPAGKASSAGQHRPQELMKPGEREFRLRSAGDRQHPHARRPGPVGGVGQQHGLAHAPAHR